MNNLKPCPFCGAKPFVTKIEPHKHNVVNLPDFKGETFVECECSAAIVDIEAWNKRIKE